MGTFRSRRYTVSAILFAAVLIALSTQPAKALVLDWDSVAWAPGSLTHSYDLTGEGINDVTVAVSSGNNTFTTDPTTGTMTPTINQSITGGTSPVQNSLMLAANLHTNSNAMVQITFTGQYGGASNVSFSIFDIDLTTNSDKIGSIYGVALDGTHVAATITNLGSVVSLTGTGLGQVLTGTAGSANSGPGSGNGNATISFGSAVITDVFFTFYNTAGAPRYQDIGIGDVSFTPVPEINPALSGAVSCLIAIGVTIFTQRRGKLRRALQD
jgi:hypothetical protein